MGAWGRGSASVLCASASASVQLIINKYGYVLCVSWLVQLMVLKYVINHFFLDLDLKLFGLYIFVLHKLLTFLFFLLSNSVLFQVGKYQTTIVISWTN